MSFSGTASSGVIVWIGNPDCQAAHDAILSELKQRISTFRTFSPIPTEPDNILKGNLGEAITFYVGFWNDFKAYRPFPANAFNPLGPIAKTEIDIVWILFDEDNIEANDIAVVQEVKTTTDNSLGLAGRLEDDYRKLFGTDQRFTLRTRLDAIKSGIEFQLQRPDLLPRVDLLAGVSPITSPKIKLVPTLVHDRQGNNAQTKMVAIRSTLCSASMGWSSSAVTAWAIGLTNLNDRLVRLAMGHN